MKTIKPSIATPWYKRTITSHGKVQTRPGQIICSDKTLERGRDHVHGRTHCIYSIDLCVEPRIVQSLQSPWRTGISLFTVKPCMVVRLFPGLPGTQSTRVQSLALRQLFCVYQCVMNTFSKLNTEYKYYFVSQKIWIQIRIIFGHPKISEYKYE